MSISNYFKGLKVIELANVLAGPAVGMFFAELGAEVIKIENKNTGGDMTRFWKLPSENQKSTISAYYSSVNWNKKVHFLNLREKKDQEFVHQLTKEADIIISNYKPGKAEKFRMDYNTIKELNTAIIYAHLSGFGEQSNRTAFDVVLQAETGFMSINGQPSSPPTKMPVALIDILAAHQLKEGILVALYERTKTGKGSFVSASLYDSAVSSLANQATNWLMAKQRPERLGSIHPNIAPYGEIFDTKDNQQIVLAIGTDKQFKKLCSILNNDDLAENNKFSTNENRVKNRNELFNFLQKSFSKFPSKTLIKTLINSDIPVGEIKTIPSILSSPESKHLILSETIENTKTLRVKSAIFTIKNQL